jgi:uncharacterized protein YecE (DUF72 family)
VTHKVRIGIGGWNFVPWRGAFYPPGLRQADELRYAGRALGAIEINATYHSLQSPESFARWAAQTPEDFVFSVKASRFCTNRKVLADAGEAIDRFLGQGLAELGSRLGPLLWQFMPTKKFDPEDFARFLDLLPEALGARPLRHVVEVRNPTFADPRFVQLCRDRSIAICLADHETYPAIDEVTSDFAYARLMRLDEAVTTGYGAAALDAWAEQLTGLSKDRDAFAFFIGAGGEGKVRAPAAVQALMARLGQPQPAVALDLPQGPARKPRGATQKSGRLG